MLYSSLGPLFLARRRKSLGEASDCELDLSAGSAKSVVHARENRSVPNFTVLRVSYTRLPWFRDIGVSVAHK